MSGLLEEMRRRNVFRVAAAYLVVGWVVLQVAELVVPILHLPDWTITMTFYIGVVGFPFALIFAWAFELTPEGLKRSEDVDPEYSIAQATGHSLNRAITGLLVVAVLILLADRFMLSQQADELEETEAAAETEGPRSIAVLPFVNMSDDPAQEYFSDGISEELLNGLAKIQELRVAARTSSFAFKGQNQDIKNIGEQLDVDTVLEGSVRKAGPRVRITAQLINVADGYHLWSETYDRELNDIFAIQDEISRAIVDALKVHLNTGEEIAVHEAVDLEAYNFYLQARHSLRRRTEKSLQLAQQQYQKAIDIDPRYAEAWAGKATATELLSQQHYGKEPIEASRRNAQSMLDIAFSIKPDLAEAHATQALLYLNHAAPRKALEHVDAAIRGNPSEGILYAWKANTLNELGRYDEAMASQDQAFRIDPLHQTIRHNVVVQEASYGNISMAREMVAPGSDLAYEVEAWISYRDGRWADAARSLDQAIAAAEGGYDLRLHFMATVNYFFNLGDTDKAREIAPPLAAQLIQTFLDQDAALATLEAIQPEYRDSISTNMLAQALLLQGRCDDMLALYASDNLLQQSIWGNLQDGGNQLHVFTDYAWCLQQVGRTSEAKDLAQRVNAFIDSAVENGMPPSHHFNQARVKAVLGETDAAIGSLKLAWQRYSLSWLDFSDPLFRDLKDEPEFQSLRKDVYSHMNVERGKLGLEPREFATR